MVNPLNVLIPEMMCYLTSPSDWRWKRNIESYNGVLLNMINERRANKVETEKNNDLLSILTTFEHYDNDDLTIIHELSGFFAAGMKTIKISTLNVIYYMTRHPEYKAKLVEEVCPAVAKAGADIVENLDYDTVQDFEYLQHCYQESLRIEPPANLTVPSTVLQECTIGKGDMAVTLKPGMLFMTLIHEIHHDPDQWIEHNVYNPARFDFKDKDNKWALTPEGKPRNPLSYNPFSGGRRVCLGKTFAETVVRFTIPMLFHFLDFEFMEESQRHHKDIYSADGTGINLPFKVIIKNLV